MFRMSEMCYTDGSSTRLWYGGWVPTESISSFAENRSCRDISSSCDSAVWECWPYG